jgi:phosphatidylglycerophosphate synthase
MPVAVSMTTEMLAVAVAVLCGLVSVSAFRFQRFTLSIAREMAAGGSREVGALQKCMTPDWMRRLEYLGYLLAMAAIVLGSQELGWVWGVAIIAWVLFGRGLVSPFWPLPSMAQCLAIANREAARGLAEARSRHEQAAQQMYQAVIARLQKAHAS